MSVFDRQSRLVAWNDRFVDLLELPGWLTQPGTGFADYLRYRIDRGDFGAETPAAMATQQERIRCRQGWKSEQVLANGTVLEVRRDPMPDGGFVTT